MSEYDKIKERMKEFKASEKETITINVNKLALDLLRDKCRHSNIPNLSLEYVIDDLIKRDTLCYKLESTGG